MAGEGVGGKEGGWAAAIGARCVSQVFFVDTEASACILAFMGVCGASFGPYRMSSGDMPYLYECCNYNGDHVSLSVRGSHASAD